MTLQQQVEVTMCDQYPACALTAYACNLLQDIVYEDDANKRRDMAVELRKDQADQILKIIDKAQKEARIDEVKQITPGNTQFYKEGRLKELRRK